MKIGIITITSNTYEPTRRKFIVDCYKVQVFSKEFRNIECNNLLLFKNFERIAA